MKDSKHARKMKRNRIIAGGIAILLILSMVLGLVIPFVI